MKKFFEQLATQCAHAMGSYLAFIWATAMTIVWALSYPIWKTGDAWMLVINTATTIVTFLAVFLIQNQSNRESKAIHTKLDIIIKYMKGAPDDARDIEDLTEEEIEAIRDRER